MMSLKDINSMMIMLDSYSFSLPLLLGFMSALLFLPSSKINFNLSKNKPLINIDNNLFLLFKTILILNISSLVPFSIPLSSMTDLVFLSSMTIWLSTIFCKILYPEKIMLQLTLSNTPIWITPVMILVETMSNIIRPVTLSLRLSGNMIVGHFLLQNISSSINLSIFLTFFFMFESVICLIQATVFSLLIQSYKSEL